MYQQLDIFNDSRDVALRNDMAQALLDGDPLAAKRIADTLLAEFGTDPVLAPGAVLVAFQHWQHAAAAQGPLDVATVLDTQHRLEVFFNLDLSQLPDLDSYDPKKSYLGWTMWLLTEASEAEITEVFEFVEGHCQLEVRPIETALTKTDPPAPAV